MLRPSCLLSAIGLTVAIASSASAQVHLVERPDAMQVYFLSDVDRLGERVRVLYQTMPSLEQQADKDGWTVNVYVAEVFPDGRVKQQRLVSSQQRYGALLLRRGHDEVFAVLAPGAPGSKPGQALVVRSTRDGSVLSTTEVSMLRGVEMGFGNIAPTDDGNLFVVSVSAHGSRGTATGISWHKLSPQGEVLGRGEYANGGTDVGYLGVFPARDGGVGLMVSTRVSRDVKRLPTDIDNPVKYAFEDDTLEAEIFSETRMLVTDSSARRLWVSGALEREFMPGAGLDMPSEMPAQEKIRVTHAHMRALEELGLEYDKRVIGHTSDAGNDSDSIKRTPAGYAMLAAKFVRRDRVPPAHGPYYLEIGTDGKLRREIYLGLLAEQIGARGFDDLLPTSDGGFLVVGDRTPEGSRESRRHVTRVDSDGVPKSIVDLDSREWRLEGIAGTSANVWLVGHRWSDELKRTLLRLEKVDMSAAKPLKVAAKASPAPEKTTPESVSVPELPAAKPGGGCTCTCDEFASIQKMIKNVDQMSNEDKMKLATDPEFTKTMQCAGQCAMAYAECGKK